MLLFKFIIYCHASSLLMFAFIMYNSGSCMSSAFYFDHQTTLCCNVLHVEYLWHIPREWVKQVKVPTKLSVLFLHLYSVINQSKSGQIRTCLSVI